MQCIYLKLWIKIKRRLSHIGCKVIFLYLIWRFYLEVSYNTKLYFFTGYWCQNDSTVPFLRFQSLRFLKFFFLFFSQNSVLDVLSVPFTHLTKKCVIFLTILIFAPHKQNFPQYTPILTTEILYWRLYTEKKKNNHFDFYTKSKYFMNIWHYSNHFIEAVFGNVMGKISQIFTIF